MKVQEIKKQVNLGKNVFWGNTAYQVKKVGEQWLIVNKYKDDAIGLTYKDNKTLNGNEADFFTGVKND
jgi:hypothetical protein